MVTHDGTAFLEHRPISPERRAAIVRLLTDLDAWLAPRSLADAHAHEIAGFLAAKLDAGLHPNTLRKWLAMVRTFYDWLYEHDEISAETLLEIKAIPMPAGSSAMPKPQAYSRRELDEIRTAVSERWPTLTDQDARRRVGRWRDGRSPYSRIRTHAIRMQTEAIISLALDLGLRRSEIFGLTVDAMHHDNAYVVVWRNGVEWTQNAREVPYTVSAREAVARWLDFRALMGLDHDSPWVHLWSGPRVGEPITRDAFECLLRTYVGAGCTFKRLRDTCAVRWINAGLPLEHTRRLLGIGSLQAMLPYAALPAGTTETALHRVEAQLG